MNTILFLGLTLAGIWAGRRAGWALSKGILYPSPLLVAMLVCIAWGLIVAYLLRIGIVQLEPHVVVRILGYGAGSYVSTLNFGLFRESTIPPADLARHKAITSVPFITFIVISLYLAFR